MNNMHINHFAFRAGEAVPFDAAAWADVLPTKGRIVGANLFGEVFVTDAAGGVSMLDVATGAIERVCDAVDDFGMDGEVLEGVLRISLVERCLEAGLSPGHDECYAFKSLPMFGGSMSVSNIWITSGKKWSRYLSLVRHQVLDLTDGDPTRLIHMP